MWSSVYYWGTSRYTKRFYEWNHRERTRAPHTHTHANAQHIHGSIVYIRWIGIIYTIHGEIYTATRRARSRERFIYILSLTRHTLCIGGIGIQNSIQCIYVHATWYKRKCSSGAASCAHTHTQNTQQEVNISNDIQVKVAATARRWDGNHGSSYLSFVHTHTRTVFFLLVLQMHVYAHCQWRS